LTISVCVLPKLMCETLRSRFSTLWWHGAYIQGTIYMYQYLPLASQKVHFVYSFCTNACVSPVTSLLQWMF